MQGFADIFVEKSQTSRANYEAVIELKYLNKEKAKTANYESLKVFYTTFKFQLSYLYILNNYLKKN